MRQTFDEQLAVQKDEGVDFVIGETFSWLGEALLAVECAKKTGLPVMVTVSLREGAASRPTARRPPRRRARWQGAGADIVGVNCLRSPEHTLPLVAEMRKAVEMRGGQPAGRLPHARPSRPTSRACPSSRWSWTRCSSAGRRWPTTRGGRGTWA